MQIVRATQSASVAPLEGEVPVNVHQGTFWPADDPVVKAYPSLFTDDLWPGLSFTRQPERPVEQATAAPGEKRATRRSS